jgi:hypothetical protein
LLVFEIINFIWAKFLEQKVYEDIKNYYDLKYDFSYLKDYESKNKSNKFSFLKGVILGLGISFLFFSDNKEID